MREEWLARWATGRIGWHEVNGNAALKTFWPADAGNKRVLVPLCGKSPDLLWLAKGGHEVVGVELAEAAIHEFYADNQLPYRVDSGKHLDCYVADTLPISIYCGDYFQFDAPKFDAFYDRGALVAIPGSLRSAYVEHTKKLLHPDAIRLIITLEYDQLVVQGPPYSVMPAELGSYWNDLMRVAETDDLATCPPKFRAAGLKKIQEVVWLAGGVEPAR